MFTHLQKFVKVDFYLHMWLFDAMVHKFSKNLGAT